jgi:hypothetical protein
MRVANEELQASRYDPGWSNSERKRAFVALLEGWSEKARNEDEGMRLSRGAIAPPGALSASLSKVQSASARSPSRTVKLHRRSQALGLNQA